MNLSLYGLNRVSVNRGVRGGRGGHLVKILKLAKGTSYYCLVGVAFGPF